MRTILAVSWSAATRSQAPGRVDLELRLAKKPANDPTTAFQDLLAGNPGPKPKPHPSENQRTREPNPTQPNPTHFFIKSSTAGLILAWWLVEWIPLPVMTRSSCRPERWPSEMDDSTRSIASRTYRPCRSMVPCGWVLLFSAGGCQWVRRERGERHSASSEVGAG